MKWTETFSYIRSIFDKERNDIIADGGGTISLDSSRNCKYPNSEPLVALFGSCEQKTPFKALLCGNVSNGGVANFDKVNVSGLCFYTLVMIGKVDRAVEYFNKRTCNFDSILIVLNYMLNSITNYFTFDHLNSIKIKIDESRMENSLLQLKRNLCTIVINKRFQIVGNIINNINIEVFQDKTDVVDKLKYYGFADTYSTFLNDIDQFILRAPLNIHNFRIVLDY